jgi:hypothetical protein
MKLSPVTPTKKIAPRTVVVETGLVKDRWKGYKSSPDHPSYNPTGSDARAALVGAYSKKKKKGFGRRDSERGESKKHEYGESADTEKAEDY